MREGLLKVAAFQALRLSGILALAEARAEGVPILAYHGVTAGGAAAPGARHALANLRRLHVSPGLFEEHLRLLCARFLPIPLSELLACHAAGRRPPRRSVVLTFDDGYRNFLTQALPLLRRHGVPATLFVVTGADRRPFWQDRLEAALARTTCEAVAVAGRRHALDSERGRMAAAVAVASALDGLAATARERALEALCAELGDAGEPEHEDAQRLSWDELRALRAAGVEVGSHTDQHEPLPARAPAEAVAALEESRSTLERELGPGAYPLSYPYGARDAVHVAAARAAGFSCGLTGVPRLTRPSDDAFALGRFLVGADDDLPRLRASLSGLRGRWRGDPWPPRT